MGRQINYYADYEAFLPVAEAALASGCIIYQHAFTDGHWILTAGTTMDIVTPDCLNYFFHLPQAGEFQMKCFGKNQHITNETRLCVIEAGFSGCSRHKKEITRNRLYVMTGRYGENSEWHARTEALTKVYNRLVRIMKKAAPYGEITHYCANPLYAGQKVTSKEYITPEYRCLVEQENYKLM